jgi:hypothetical protein
VVLVYWSIKGWHQLKCISTSERFVAVSINGMLIINVYFPKLVDPVKYGDDMSSLFAVIRLVINDNRKQRLLIGGDSNFEFNKSQPGYHMLNDFMNDLSVSAIHFMVQPLATGNYYLNQFSFIDFFVVNADTFREVVGGNIIHSGVNLSVTIDLKLNWLSSN